MIFGRGHLLCAKAIAKLFRRYALFSKGAQTQRVVALGKADACFVAHEVAMEIGRRGEAERALQKDLARRGLQQVAAAHDFCDFHRRVIHDGVFTSAGVSAGIDMSFALVEEICGRGVAIETAHYIEYPWGQHDVPKHQNAL